MMFLAVFLAIHTYRRFSMRIGGTRFDPSDGYEADRFEGNQCPVIHAHAQFG